jgi:hypothetical protein
MNLSVVLDVIRFLLVVVVCFYVFLHSESVRQRPSGHGGSNIVEWEGSSREAWVDASAVMWVHSLQGLGERTPMVFEKSHLMRLRASGECSH